MTISQQGKCPLGLGHVTLVGARTSWEHEGDLSGPISFESEWTGWKANRQESDTARSTTINYTYSFDQVGKMVEWRVRVKDANGNWSRHYNIAVSWGLKSKHSTHYVIKREWFYPEDCPVLN